MRLNLGCQLSYDLPQPTPMIVMLNVHYSRAPDLERVDLLTTNPGVPLSSYRDHFGNWCTRLVAPAGRFTLRTDGVIRDAGRADDIGEGAYQHKVEDLPDDAIVYLLGSRYCETDLLMDYAWQTFGNVPEGWARAKAVVDHVHNLITFDYMQARPTRTAAEALAERTGVCRDFAHLAVALCRALNIPTRYCTGYISDVNQPKPWPPMDFAAWIEVYLGGRWWTLDPRNNDTRYGRVLVARGRDAADVPLTNSFGPHMLAEFQVWIDELDEAAAA